MELKIKNLPALPGCYLMKNAQGRIIYVGKAKNLRARVRNYYQKEADNRYQVAFLLKRVKDIDYLVCKNEKEALLLENSLIKKHKPKYNIFLKDDKSYVSLKLSVTHDFPRLTLTRRIRKDGALYYGPYSSAQAVRETLDLIYRHFQLRTCSDNEFRNRSRPCLEYQIKRCTAPCVGYVGREEYAQQVLPVKAFLEGKNKDFIREVKNKMNKAAEAEDFERAAEFRDLLNHIKATLEKQHVMKHAGGDSDIVTLYRREEAAMVALLHIRSGALIDSRFYPVASAEDDKTLLNHFVNRLYLDAPFIPDEIIVPLPLEDGGLLSEHLEYKKGRKVVIRLPKKGEKKRLLEMAQTNAIAQFEKHYRGEKDLASSLEGLAKKLCLPRVPHRMECYDISNISGTHATASRVVFINGKREAALYRHYKIRLQKGPDDYAMLSEVISRRFGRPDDPGNRPDLVVIDGGKGQLTSALRTMKDLGVTVSAIAIAKGHGRGARAKGEWAGKKEEEIYLPGRKNPVKFRSGSAELKLLQRLRDEAHRFALRYHRKLRDTL